jgi:hypothetical protein
MSDVIGPSGRVEFIPNPLRLAIFNSVPAWRRFRSLHQVPDLPGEFIHTRDRVIVAVRDSQLRKELARYGVYEQYQGPKP